MKLHLVKGSTNVRLSVFLQDASASNGAGLGGLTATSMTLNYYRPDATSALATSLITSGTLGTFSAGSFLEVVDTDAVGLTGFYQLCPVDATFASGVDAVVMLLESTGSAAPVPIEVQLTDVNLNDGVRGGMTALPNAAVEAAGGLYTRGSGAGQINQSNNGRVDTDTITLSAAAVDDIWDEDIVAAHGGTSAAGFLVSALSNRNFVGPSDAVGIQSVLGAMLNTLTGTWGFARATDSLESIRDNQAGADINAIASGVWAATLTTSAYATVTMAGERLTVLDDNYTATRGTGLDNLDAAVSSRAIAGDAMALTAAAVDDIWDENIVSAHGGTSAAGFLVSALTNRNFVGPSDAVGIQSVLGAMLNTLTGTWGFARGTDSLEAIRDRGDAAWITATTVDLNADQSGVTIGTVNAVAAAGENGIASAVWDTDIVAAHGATSAAGFLVSALTNRNFVGPSDAVGIQSVLGAMLNTLTGTWGFTRATDSLEAIRDRGDAAWITATTVDLNADQSGVTVGTVNSVASTARVEIASAVWAATLTTSAYATVTMAGERLTVLDDNYTATRGTGLDNLDAAVSSRAIAGDAMALTAAAVDDIWDENIVSAHGGTSAAGFLVSALSNRNFVGPSDAVGIESVLGAILNKTTGTWGFARTTDSLEAIRDNQAGADVNAIASAVWDTNIVTAHGATSAAGFLVSALTNRNFVGPSDAVGIQSVLGAMLNTLTGTWGFARATDSLEAIRDNQAGADINAIASGVWAATLTTGAYATLTMAGERLTVLDDNYTATRGTGLDNLDVVLSTRASGGAAMNLTAQAVDDVWDENIVSAHGGTSAAGFLVSALSNRNFVGPSDAVGIQSVLGAMLNTLTGTWGFARGTDSLESLRDNQSGSTPTAIASAVWAATLTTGAYATLTMAGERLTVLDDNYTATRGTGLDNLDAAITSRAVAGDAMALTAAAVDDIWDENIVSAHGGTSAAGFLVSALTNRNFVGPSAAVGIESVLGAMFNTLTGTWGFARGTDSLEAIRDRGDSAWITATTVNLNADQSGVTIGTVNSVASTARVEIASAVWAATLTTGAYATLTMAGERLTVLDDNYTATRGTGLDNLDAAVSSRAIAGDAMALTAAAVDDIWDENVVSAHGGTSAAGFLVSALTNRNFVGPSDAVGIQSVLGAMLNTLTATWGFVRGTDSLEAIRDRGDAAWTATAATVTGITTAAGDLIADSVLGFPLSSGTGTTARDLRNAARFLRNRWEVSGTTLTVYNETDAVAAWTSTLATTSGADDIKGSDPA